MMYSWELSFVVEREKIFSMIRFDFEKKSIESPDQSQSIIINERSFGSFYDLLFFVVTLSE